ncbi:GSCOCG00006459001-RA-CDS [Cotesia congregata]|nr:GSCOCG00006459001-RA-CDS [Cotesia congregata]
MATLSENIFINAKIGGSRGNYVITPKIPDGLAAAVENLTREVIRHHPPDIYVFAAQHFSNLLQLRDQNYPKINRHHSQPIIYDSSSSSVSSSCHQVTRESPSEWQQCHHYHQQKTSKRSKPNYYSQYERTRDFPVVITEHHHHHHHHQRRKSRDIKSQSPSVISNDEMLAKDIKTKLKKNRISSRERSESMRSNKAVTTSMTNLSMNKVKDYVVNKFSHSSSFDEPPNYYVSKVQDVITATEPIINEKLKVFRETKSLSRQSTHSQTQDLPENNLNINSNALEARLNETHNILKDISSCFSMRSNKNRPHSADFVAGVARRRKYHEATDELEAMLHETHNLLQGISSSLLKENNLRKFKQEDHLPSVQNTAVKDAVKVCDNKSLFGSFALPPVVTTSSSSSSVANDDQIFKVEKVKQDLTLPVLIPAVVDNSCDIEEQMKGDDTEAKNEAKDEAKNETKAKNEAEAKKKEIKEETCYILTEDNDKSKIPSNITTVIISDQVRSNNDQEIQSDPLLDSFGEVIVAQPIESAISINDLVDPDDLMMKNKVRVIKQDLQCINEEEGGEDSPSSRTETGEQENQVEIESDHELKVIDYQKEEMTSSVKETSVETDLGSPKSLDGRGETEQSSGDGGDVGESITADLAESSSNEAKETTVTDNCTTEPLIQSLSLDEPVRPFVPELNLDSLQDITVSSFKLTPTDDESEQPEDNEISNTLIESADVFTTATVDNSSEKIEDVCSLQVVETDKSDKDGEEISLEVEKVSGGFNETEKVDEVLEEYSDKEDKQEPDGENDMAKLNRALIVIQAAIRGFLARRRRRQLEKIKEDNLISSILLAEDTTILMMKTSDNP